MSCHTFFFMEFRLRRSCCLRDLASIMNSVCKQSIDSIVIYLIWTLGEIKKVAQGNENGTLPSMPSPPNYNSPAWIHARLLLFPSAEEQVVRNKIAHKFKIKCLNFSSYIHWTITWHLILFKSCEKRHKYKPKFKYSH